MLSPSSGCLWPERDSERLRFEVKVAGIRDFALGVAAWALYYFNPRAMRIFAPCTALVALGDAAMTVGQPFPVPSR